MFKVVEWKLYKEVDIKALDKKELIEALWKMQDALEVSLSWHHSASKIQKVKELKGLGVPF